MSARERPDVIVIGGGIIGMSIAWRAAQLGLAVTVLERDEVGSGSSHVAAGMLAPASEAEFGAPGARLLELGVASGAAWPGFAADLSEASGTDVLLAAGGTLMVARDADEAQELERAVELRRSRGSRVERLLPSEARLREPALAPTLRLALDLPDDVSIDPRPVLHALTLACRAAGVEVREGTAVEEVLRRRGPVGGFGVRVRGGGGGGGGEELRSRELVVAAGAWSGSIAGLELGGRPAPVRPVRGQILRLRDPAGDGLVRRTLRWFGGYLVPRGDGRYALGATVEERGFRVTATAGGIGSVLRDAQELVPGIDELEIEELDVGLRPGSPDNAPLLGRSEAGGVVWACGHYRNGILLAPLTAELVAAVLAGDEDGLAPERRELLAACAPERFSSGGHGGQPADDAGEAVLSR